MCAECLIGKQKKPILFQVTEPSSVPYRAPSACAKMAAYPDPPPVIPVPESIAAQAVEAPNYAARSSDAVSPAFRPRSSSVHTPTHTAASAPDAHPRPPRPAETLQCRPRRGRALTPPAQTLRTPQCTPPVTARPGPAHAAAPCARPAPNSPAPNFGRSISNAWGGEESGGHVL